MDSEDDHDLVDEEEDEEEAELDGLSDEDDVEDIDEAAVLADRRDSLFGGQAYHREPARVRTRLSPLQARVMGEANMAYSNRDIVRAKEMALDIVKDQPQAAEPYRLLGVIAEEEGELQSAIDFYSIATKWEPTDLRLRLTLYDLVEQAENWQHALLILKDICQLDKNNALYQKKRGDVASRLENNQAAIDAYKAYLRLSGDNDIQIQTELARLYRVTGKVDKARDIAQKQFDRMKEEAEQNPHYNLNLELINLVTEAYMSLKHYDEAADILHWARRQYKGNPSSFPLELTVKHGICLLQLGDHDQANRYLTQLGHKPVEEYYELFFEVGDCYYLLENFEKALLFYERVLPVKPTDTQVVLYRIADCYHYLNDEVNARKYFEKVFEIDPTFVRAAEALAHYFAEEGKVVEALDICDRHLAALDPSKTPDTALVVQRGLLLYKLSRYQEFVQLCLPILTDKKHQFYRKRRRLKDKAKNSDETPLAFKPQSKRQQMKDRKEAAKKKAAASAAAAAPVGQLTFESLQNNLNALNTRDADAMDTSGADGQGDGGLVLPPSTYDADGFAIPANKPASADNDEPMEEEEEADDIEEAQNPAPGQLNLVEKIGSMGYLELLRSVTKTLFYQFHDLATARATLTNGLRYLTRESILQLPGSTEHELRFLLAKICIGAQDYLAAMDQLRLITHADPDNVAVWNELCKCIHGITRIDASPDTIKYTKSFERMLLKHPSNLMLRNMVANLKLMTSNSKMALPDFFKCYEHNPSSPLPLLCIATSYLNYSMMRTTADRNLYVVQAFAYFFKYGKQREWDQEASYNVARGFHHLGLFPWAIHLYEKVLSLPPRADGKDLKVEAAYNLAHIYTKSNPALAKKLLRDYVSF